MAGKKQFGSRSRDDFDDDGFFESVLKRQGTEPMPPSMAKLLMGVAGLAVLVTIFVVGWATWPSEKGRVDENTVPVMHASTEAYKIKPEEPGGMEVPNRESTIFDTLNEGEPDHAERKVENLLEDTEKPMSKEQAFGIDDETTDEEQPEETVKLEPAPTPEAKPQPVAKPVVKEAPKPVVIAKPAPAPKVEPKPTPVVEKPKVAPKAAPKAVRIASGTSYVQFAAVKSDADARTKWSKLQSQYSILKGLPLRVQKANLGAKGTFYRVQAGPMSLDQANSTCAKVKSAKGDCLVIK